MDNVDALIALARHEGVCEERYRRIDEKLIDLSNATTLLHTRISSLGEKTNRYLLWILGTLIVAETAVIGYFLTRIFERILAQW